MIFSIIINIMVVLVIVGIDAWRHQFKTIRFSTLLLALSINAIIDFIIVHQYIFISYYTLGFLIVWTGLQYYVDHKTSVVRVQHMKIVAIIVTAMMSSTLHPLFKTSEQSFYMSVPYLAPSIFIFGAILVFASTFSPSEIEALHVVRRIKRRYFIGTIFVVLSLTTMTLLTPYGVIFMVIHVLFIAFFYRLHKQASTK